MNRSQRTSLTILVELRWLYLQSRRLRLERSPLSGTECQVWSGVAAHGVNFGNETSNTSSSQTMFVSCPVSYDIGSAYGSYSTATIQWVQLDYMDMNPTVGNNGDLYCYINGVDHYRGNYFSAPFQHACSLGGGCPNSTNGTFSNEPLRLASDKPQHGWDFEHLVAVSDSNAVSGRVFVDNGISDRLKLSVVGTVEAAPGPRAIAGGLPGSPVDDLFGARVAPLGRNDTPPGRLTSCPPALNDPGDGSHETAGRDRCRSRDGAGRRRAPRTRTTEAR